MTAERVHGQVVFYCDFCTETLETYSEEFSEAVQIKKREGWGSRKERDGWADICDECTLNPDRDD